MGRLFGTDGVRGIANVDITCELAINIGRAAAMVLASNTNKKPRILIGKDTRISSDMLESSIAAGLLSVGADAVLLGVVPTPAVAYLVQKYKADAGIMISASHNPFEYNGIKIFSSQGLKLPDEMEDTIEKIINEEKVSSSKVSGKDIGHLFFNKTSVKDYVSYLLGTVKSLSFKGLKIAFDCANGSASATARRLFLPFGAQCIFLNDTPDGININDSCGSTHIEYMMDFVKKNGLNAGFSFDGDADRCLAVDENGQLVDGDKIIAICANFMKQNGMLKNNTVVATVMSNMGFFDCCKRLGINVVTTKVGDRYVLEEMLNKSYCIGGEQSGHIIFLEHENTGDGQLTALMLLDIMKQTGKKLSELASIMDTYPQVLINIKVSPKGKEQFNHNEEIKKAIKAGEDKLGDEGRVLVRVSGTEPLIRVMTEGKDADKIYAVANEIAAVVKERLS